MYLMANINIIYYLLVLCGSISISIGPDSYIDYLMQYSVRAFTQQAYCSFRWPVLYQYFVE
jgi:hypothetical protein